MFNHKVGVYIRQEIKTPVLRLFYDLTTTIQEGGICGGKVGKTKDLAEG